MPEQHMNMKVSDKTTQEILERIFPAGQQQWFSKVLSDKGTENLFRAIDNEIYLTFNDSMPTFLVTSAVQGEGKTTISLIVAILTAIYYPERHILYVDASNGSQEILKSLISKNQKGQYNVFSGDNLQRKKIAYASSLSNLHFVNFNKTTMGGGRLTPGYFEQFFNTAKNNTDMIIVDAPTLTQDRLMLSIAKILHNVLLVVQYGGPNREQIQNVTNELQGLGNTIIGTVINRRNYPVPKTFYNGIQ